MIDLPGAVITRLRAQSASLLDVDDAAALADLVARNVVPPRVPAAWVLPLVAAAEPAAYATGVTDQRVTETVAVVLAVSASGDKTGGRAAGDIGALVRETVGVLHGWQPDPDADPLELRRWSLLDIRGGRLFAQVDLTTRTHLRDGD